MDILGINGVVYKGRLSSPAANRTVTVGKDFPGRGAAPGHRVSSSQAVQPPELACPTISAWDGSVPHRRKAISSLASPCANSVSASHSKAMKSPQPRSRHTAEKMRRVSKYGSHYVSPYSCECLSRVSPRPLAPPHGLSLLPSTPRGVAPHARLFVLLHCRCCHADEDGLLGGPVAGCHGWEQDGRCLSQPGGCEMAWGSGEGAGAPGLCCLASGEWWGGGHTALAPTHRSGVTPQAIKMLSPLLPLLHSPWAHGGTWGVLGELSDQSLMLFGCAMSLRALSDQSDVRSVVWPWIFQSHGSW